MEYKIYKIPEKDISQMKSSYTLLDMDLKKLIEGKTDDFSKIMKLKEELDDYLIDKEIIVSGEINDDYLNNLSIQYGLVLSASEIEEICEKAENTFTNNLKEVYEDHNGYIIQTY